jgi:hypothetical protein
MLRIFNTSAPFQSVPWGAEGAEEESGAKGGGGVLVLCPGSIGNATLLGSRASRSNVVTRKPLVAVVVKAESMVGMEIRVLRAQWGNYSWSRT